MISKPEPTAFRPDYVLFRRDGCWLHAHPDVASPWTDGAVSGAGVSALVAALSEEVPVPFPFFCTRMSLELLRPVPAKALQWQPEIVREGRRQQVLRITLRHQERPCAQATFVRLRTADSPQQDGQAPSSRRLPRGVPFVPTVDNGAVGFLRQIETHLAPRQDHANRQGWLRFHGQVIAGVPATPFARAALFADFGNGMASGVDPARFTFQNAELSLHLARPASGEWLHLDCRTLDGGNGLGMTRVVFADEAGEIGYSHQSLLLDPRS